MKTSFTRTTGKGGSTQQSLGYKAQGERAGEEWGKGRRRNKNDGGSTQHCGRKNGRRVATRNEGPEAASGKHHWRKQLGSLTSASAATQRRTGGLWTHDTKDQSETWETVNREAQAEKRGKTEKGGRWVEGCGRRTENKGEEGKEDEPATQNKSRVNEREKVRERRGSLQKKGAAWQKRDAKGPKPKAGGKGDRASGAQKQQRESTPQRRPTRKETGGKGGGKAGDEASKSRNRERVISMWAKTKRGDRKDQV